EPPIPVFRITDSAAVTPFLVTDAQQRVYLSWVTESGDSARLQYVVWEDGKWSDTQTIASGMHWFINWADYPMLSVHPNGHLMAHYLQRSDTGRYTYDVMFTQCKGVGAAWTPPQKLHSDTVKAEHGFVSIVPFGDHFFAAWLDGRNTAAAGEAALAHDHHGGHGAMTLRGAVVDLHGRKLEEWELDNRVCDCCQTTGAVSEDGPVVVYRNRSEEEVRDMGVVRYANGGWSAPDILYPQDWKISGCPVNGPRMEARGKQLAVAFFSAAHDTASVHVIFSADGGKTFGKPVRIDEGRPQGRVDIAWVDDETVVASWLENGDLKVVKVNTAGVMGSPLTIAMAGKERAAGFPQITVADQTLFVAWRALESAAIQVATVAL
ncbi:MAG: hypothetical protein MUF29_08925, partial [Chitinophagaceae bacterium]|nr:hypothetical protein [Chitinophagaceae bacterium]